MKPASRTFSLPINTAGDVVDIKLAEPPLTAENLRLTTWGSSFVLANRLRLLDVERSTLPAANSTLNVLELGAGTGLVGISAAAIWRTNVVLSDLGPIVPGLVENIAANIETLTAIGGSASSGTLDWAHPSELLVHSPDPRSPQHTLHSETDKATIILAADTVYSEEHPALLSNAILAWLKHDSDARAIISYPMRVAYLDEIRELWELLQRGGLEAIDEGREKTGDDWDDEALHEWSVWRWRTVKGNE